MTRIRRTAALTAAAVLALGVTACSPSNEKGSDAPNVTTVSPDSGYEGGGKATATTEAAVPAGPAEGADALVEAPVAH